MANQQSVLIPDRHTLQFM